MSKKCIQNIIFFLKTRCKIKLQFINHVTKRKSAFNFNPEKIVKDHKFSTFHNKKPIFAE